MQKLKFPRWALWLSINTAFLIGVPVFAYYSLLNEVHQGYRNGTINTNSDSIGIPFMNIIVLVVAITFVFNVVYLICCSLAVFAERLVTVQVIE